MSTDASAPLLPSHGVPADASAPLLPPKPPAAAAPAPIPRAKRRNALGVSRYIASCWICAFHYYKGFGSENRYGIAVTGNYWPSAGAWDGARHYFSWGCTWTSYFFFLSGFVLALSRLDSSSPDKLKPTLRFVADRLVTTYPIYLLGLLLEVVYVADKLYEYGRMEWVTFAKHLFMVQSWWATQAMSFWQQQEPAWFMSALLFYWAIFNASYRVLRRLPSMALWPAMVRNRARAPRASVSLSRDAPRVTPHALLLTFPPPASRSARAGHRSSCTCSTGRSGSTRGSCTAGTRAPRSTSTAATSGRRTRSRTCTSSSRA